MKHLILFSILIITSSCWLNYDGTVVPYVDTYNNWIDSVNVDPQPLVVDTCEQLFFLSDTEYVMLITEVGVTDWFYGDEIFGAPTVPLLTLIDSILPQMTYNYYEQNGRISIVMEGQGLHNVNWLKFGSHDAIGQGLGLNPYYNSLTPMGSMTYEEFKFESAHRLNTNYFSLLGSNFLPFQNNDIARTNIHAEVCKHGGDYASYHDADGMLQSVIDSTNLFLWDRVRLVVTSKRIKS